MKFTTFFTAGLSTVLASSTSVLLPLYVYPSPGVWNPVFDAITAHPNVLFYVVVNPDSGPGASAYPDSVTAPAIAQLNSHANVRVLGYVHTTYATEPVDVLNANITKYGNWDTYTANNISVSGIFFDEAPTSSDSAPEAYMRSASFQARASTNQGFTVFNPGALTDPSYFNDADLIVQVETGYSQYNSVNTPLSIPANNRGRSAILVHDVPPSADINGIIRNAVSQGIGSIYLTNDCCYNVLGLVGPVANAVASS